MGLQLSGSVQLEGNLLVTGSANSVFENISVTNRITANEINVQFVSSSIIYSSGSNRFGDESGDKHQFTGSVDVSGTGTFSNSVRSNSHIIVSDGGGSSVVLQGYIADTLRIASAGSTNDGGSRGNLIAGQLIAANANIEGSTTASAGLINGVTDAFFDLNRSASGNASRVRFQTVGTDEFEIGLKGGVPGFHITNGAATELLTISGSNVGVGTVNPVAPVHVVGTVEANGSLYRGVFGGTSVQDADMTGLTGGNGSELQIQSPTTTRGAFLTLGGGMAFGEAMGGMAFYNSNNVDGKRCRAFIIGGQDGATAGEQGSYLSFGTVDNTGNTPSEGIRLTRSGNTIVSGSLTVGKGITVSSEAFGSFFGKFGAASTALLELREFTGDQTGTTLILRSSRPDSGNLYAHIQAFSDSTTQVFRVLANGVVDNLTGAYGSLSDIKLKENIVDATPKLEDLLKVKIRNYNLIGDETKQIGVIAQELEETFPGLVSEYEDFEEVEITDEEGNVTKEKQPTGTTTKSVKYSIFVPMLIKAIQEQQSQIEELKTKVEQLQNN